MSPAKDELWPEADDKLLRKWWGKKDCSEIGKMLQTKRSKSAVTGRAHRMGLRVLPSPIKPSVPQVAANPAVRAPDPERVAWLQAMHWEPGDPQLWKHRPKVTDYPIL